MLSTNTTILPCAYLGSIEYFAYLYSNNHTIEVNDNFVKQSLRTRCYIYGANGILTLTVPRVRKNSSRTIFKDIKINYDHPWQKEHWQSFVSAYRSSPFFEYYEDEFYQVFHKKYNYLLDLNMELMHFIFNKIQVSIQFKLSKSYIEDDTINDLRLYNFNQKKFPRYMQVFENKHGFISNLSILDLLFNEGNKTKSYLEKIII